MQFVSRFYLYERIILEKTRRRIAGIAKWCKPLKNKRIFLQFFAKVVQFFAKVAKVLPIWNEWQVVGEFCLISGKEKKGEQNEWKPDSREV